MKIINAETEVLFSDNLEVEVGAELVVNIEVCGS